MDLSNYSLLQCLCLLELVFQLGGQVALVEDQASFLGVFDKEMRVTLRQAIPADLETFSRKF
jgi:hypothetical protein